MLYTFSADATVPSNVQSSFVRNYDQYCSSDATFFDINEMFNKLMLNCKKSIKQEVLEMYGECTWFSKEENMSLENYIKKNSIEEKANIFDYYD